MNCRQARKYMIPFLDGELEDDAELTTHLETCEACRREVGEFQRSFEQLLVPEKEGEQRLQPSPYLLTRLNRRIDEIEQYSFWIPLIRGLRWLLAPDQLVMAGWGVALLLICLELGNYFQIETIAFNPGADPRLAETRVELRLGDLMQVTLLRFVGA